MHKLINNYFRRDFILRQSEEEPFYKISYIFSKALIYILLKPSFDSVANRFSTHVFIYLTTGTMIIMPFITEAFDSNNLFKIEPIWWH